MLSIALLPVGLIALYQTSHVVRQAEQLERAALVGQALSAVASQSDLIHEGFAAARVLGGALRDDIDDPEACHDLMRGFVRSHPAYALATFVGLDGVSRCNSRGVIADLNESQMIKSLLEAPRHRVDWVEQGRISGRSVIVISQPVHDDLNLIGFVTLSLPRGNIQLDPDYTGLRKPLNLITLNEDGQVVLTPGALDDARAQLPAFRDLRSFLYRRANTFEADDMTGENRLYTVVPVIPGVAFAVAVWDTAGLTGSGSFVSRAALAFPLLMWAISLIVAYVAVHRLVIRHIRALRRKMRDFGNGSTRFSSQFPSGSDRAPAEIKQMEESFDAMVERIVRDTAELENNLHENNVLLKEVHHRVKNNLQLIASIMNLEIRKARNGETRSTLRRVQDRVLGLAMVHSNLYHTSRLASLRADGLLDDILRQTLKSVLPADNVVDVSMEIEEMLLYPDQAVPLSLLATEAATNAIKYIGRPADGSRPWIRVKLEQTGERTFLFSVANSCGERLDLREDEVEGTGLGRQLIDAFATQLGSRAVVTADDDSFMIAVEIQVRDFNTDQAA
ncbi:sensor histidine kinase [Oceanicola sp. 22II-s10i]|uniref:sensor histidine kinase n=1 Tax=Oceanicola sp. 22II-s10i TaxID=1317116 RepID=UPI001C3DB364|nr:histidine kinase dimerization/phosphoacceptor domain -containing protein [Oceanicola sp. 22II-s10i]